MYTTCAIVYCDILCKIKSRLLFVFKATNHVLMWFSLILKWMSIKNILRPIFYLRQHHYLWHYSQHVDYAQEFCQKFLYLTFYQVKKYLTALFRGTEVSATIATILSTHGRHHMLEIASCCFERNGGICGGGPVSPCGTIRRCMGHPLEIFSTWAEDLPGVVLAYSHEGHKVLDCC